MSSNDDCFLNNTLEKDFQKMLRPYYLTQKLLCVSQYSIKNNFVLPNSKAYCAVNIIAPCFVAYAYLSTGLTMSCTMANHCPLVTNMQYFLKTFVVTTCTIFQRKNAVKLLIRMQGIDRKFKCFGVTNLNYFVVKNWLFIFSILLFYVPVLLVNYLSNTDHFSWTIYVTWFLVIISDLEILYATFVVDFLSSRLKYFSSLFYVHNESLLHISDEYNLSAKFKNIATIPKEILQAFTEASRLLQYSVLANIISAFIDSLLSLQILIEWTRATKDSVVYIYLPFMYVLIVMWHLKNYLALVIMFSMACERFYSRVDGVKSICAVVLELQPEQSEYQKTAKNVLRLCDVRNGKMRLCGLFSVDAVLPLRLAGLVATYCIVLLQFAFL